MIFLFDLGGRAKLSTRFQTAQKLNYKLAALSSFASAASSSINVKRSKTFNISDVQEQLAAIGNGSQTESTKTLPKQSKSKKLSAARAKLTSSNSISSLSHHSTTKFPSTTTKPPTGHYLSRQQTCDPSMMSMAVPVGTGSTASSRKSSNSSNSVDEGCSMCSCSCSLPHEPSSKKTEVSLEALQEIAAFEAFMSDFVQKQQLQQSSEGSAEDVTQQLKVKRGHHHHHNKKASLRRLEAVSANENVSSSATDLRQCTGSNNNNNSSQKKKAHTLERQKKITSKEIEELGLV